MDNGKLDLIGPRFWNGHTSHSKPFSKKYISSCRCGENSNCESRICDTCEIRGCSFCNSFCGSPWFKIILNRDKSVVQPDTCEYGSDLCLRPNSDSDLQLRKKVEGGFVSKCQNNKGKTLSITSETQPTHCCDDTLQLWTVHNGVITESQKWFLKNNGDQIAQKRCPNKCWKLNHLVYPHYIALDNCRDILGPRLGYQIRM